MFAVEAMHNYGRDEEAVASAYRLFDHAKGLLGGEPINETTIRKRETGSTPRILDGRRLHFIRGIADAFFLHQSRVSTHSANASLTSCCLTLFREHVTSSETRS